MQDKTKNNAAADKFRVAANKCPSCTKTVIKAEELFTSRLLHLWWNRRPLVQKTAHEATRPCSGRLSLLQCLFRQVGEGLNSEDQYTFTDISSTDNC